MISKEDDVQVRIPAFPCANFPGCKFDYSKRDDFSEDERRGRMLCAHCSRIESDRMKRWIEADRPTAAESIAKAWAILKRPPRYKAVGKWQPVGVLKERVPGEDDEELVA